MSSDVSPRSKLRYLSPFERLLWLLDFTTPRHFCVAAQIDGRASIDQWKRALLMVQRRHPLLRASIELDDRDMPYFREMRDNPISLCVVQGNGPSQLDECLAQELGRPFGPAPESLLRATLIDEPAGCSLILAAHHSIADARGLSFVIRDLLQALNGEPLIPLSVPPSNERALGIVNDTGDDDAFQRATQRVPQDIAALGSVDTHTPSHVLRRRFSSMLTRAIRGRARTERSSVTAAIASALITVLSQAGQHSARLAVAISTRESLGLGEQCVLATDGTMMDIHADEPLDFWARSRRLKTQLASARSIDRIAESRRSLTRLQGAVRTVEQAREFGAGMFVANLVISNLGVLPIETRHGAFALKGLFGPVMLMPAPRIGFLGVATLDDELSLVYSSFAPPGKLLDQVERLLQTACER
jgi:hypothetical protein